MLAVIQLDDQVACLSVVAQSGDAWPTAGEWIGLSCFMPTNVLRRRQQILNNYISELGSGSGRSEFQMSAATSHEPSACLRHITRTLPVSLTGSGMSEIV